MDLNNIPRLIFCSGMTRSASRWSYQTCQELEKSRTPIEEYSVGYLGENEEVIDANIACVLVMSKGAAVFASHLFSPRALEIIQHRLAKNVYTYRDPRDSIASSMRMDNKGYDFAFAKAEFSLSHYDRFSNDGHSLILTYADIVDNPVAVTMRISDYLEMEITVDEIHNIHLVTERLAIKRRNEQRRKTAVNLDDVEAIDQGLEVLLGEIKDAPSVYNPWRYNALTEEQYMNATQRLRPWLEKMNYSTSATPPWKMVAV
jgi:hypothetical protein